MHTDYVELLKCINKLRAKTIPFKSDIHQSLIRLAIYQSFSSLAVAKRMNAPCFKTNALRKQSPEFAGTEQSE